MSLLALEQIDWADQDAEYAARFGDRVVLYRTDSGVADYPITPVAQRTARRPRPSIGHRVPLNDTRPSGASLRERYAREFDYPKGTARYRVVDGPTAHLRAEKLHAAGVAMTLASVELGIPPPRIVWLLAAGDSPSDAGCFHGKPMWGVASRASKTIGVLGNLEPALVVQVVAHEAFHLTQREGLDEAAEEAPAYEFGDRVRDLLVVKTAGLERIVDVHVHDACPRGSSIFVGVARADDLLLAPDYRGIRAVWRNRGSSTRPEWTQLG